MARKIYHLEAMIVGSRPQGEASRLLFLLSAELGLITVLARGVREQKSKMRSHLYHWTPLQVSLVKGREGWHLTGVASTVGPVAPLVRVMLGPFGRLVIKLLPEAAPAPDLYVLIKDGAKFLSDLALPSQPRNLAPAAALLLILRLLSRLGYLPRLTSLPDAVWHEEWRTADLILLQTKEREAVALINQAIAASQL